ncbi:MAG: Gfo/Idh/MocA family oxidoreductase [Chloroflexota bacterium]
MAHPIRLALVGAGLFARDAHVPAIKALDNRFEIAAVYSRSRATAEALLPLIPGKPEIFTDLDTLLARPDIEAVNVLLPINNLAGAIEKALAAGKHVVSEKPIAPDVATGRRLIEQYRKTPNLVWMVAENCRYESVFQRAAEIIQSGELGKLIVAHWALHLPTRAGNKYYATEWRRASDFPGGFLLDGGVHHVAVLRQVLGEIISVSAEAQQMASDLPPADTMSAVIQFASGVIGNYTVTYAAGAPFPTHLNVIGEKGVLRVNHGTLEVTTDDMPLNEAVRRTEGVEEELAAFAAAVRDGKPHRNSPLEGLCDVAVVEAMLKSAQTGKRVSVETFADLES